MKDLTGRASCATGVVELCYGFVTLRENMSEVVTDILRDAIRDFRDGDKAVLLDALKDAAEAVSEEPRGFETCANLFRWHSMSRKFHSSQILRSVANAIEHRKPIEDPVFFEMLTHGLVSCGSWGRARKFQLLRKIQAGTDEPGDRYLVAREPVVFVDTRHIFGTIALAAVAGSDSSEKSLTRIFEHLPETDDDDLDPLGLNAGAVEAILRASHRTKILTAISGKRTPQLIEHFVNCTIRTTFNVNVQQFGSQFATLPAISDFPRGVDAARGVGVCSALTRGNLMRPAMLGAPMALRMHAAGSMVVRIVPLLKQVPVQIDLASETVSGKRFMVSRFHDEYNLYDSVVRADETTFWISWKCQSDSSKVIIDWYGDRREFERPIGDIILLVTNGRVVLRSC
jgi:hypothetical protein